MYWGTVQAQLSRNSGMHGCVVIKRLPDEAQPKPLT